jgi:hypothetical protein
MSKKMKVPLNLLTLSSDPVFGSAGDVYFNLITKNIKLYNGLVWVDITPASTDPTPFYMHTHTYDGDVHTIDVGNQITFKEINLNSLPEEDLPDIIGIDGGAPNDVITNAQSSNLSLMDGGNVGN